MTCERRQWRDGWHGGVIRGQRIIRGERSCRAEHDDGSGGRRRDSVERKSNNVTQTIDGRWTNCASEDGVLPWDSTAVGSEAFWRLWAGGLLLHKVFF